MSKIVTDHVQAGIKVAWGNVGGLNGIGVA